MFPSIGGASYSPKTLKLIRLIRKGCANRPFFHIVVMEGFKGPKDPVIEQIGNYDPLPNSNNEKLCAINFSRLEHWIREGAEITVPMRKLLGLVGYFPIHPGSFQDAWNRRLLISERLQKLQAEVAEIEKSQGEKSEDSMPSPDNATTSPTDLTNNPS